jgi:hypothetical protein
VEALGNADARPWRAPIEQAAGTVTAADHLYAASHRHRVVAGGSPVDAALGRSSVAAVAQVVFRSDCHMDPVLHPSACAHRDRHRLPCRIRVATVSEARWGIRDYVRTGAGSVARSCAARMVS